MERSIDCPATASARTAPAISTDDHLTHLRGVHAAERDLRDPGVVWRMVESGAAISCPEEVAPILPTLKDTRVRLDELHQRLVAQMVQENQAELADELSAKAQCAIDILVRNLCERTADVGFLATDDVVRAVIALRPGASEGRQQQLSERDLASPAECQAIGSDGSDRTEAVLVQLLDSRLVGGADAEPSVESLAGADVMLAEAA